jgi:hypothetical protein
VEASEANPNPAVAKIYYKHYLV